MQFPDELNCPQCESDFKRASELLKHFASHAVEEFISNTNPGVETPEQKQSIYKYWRKISELHTIIRTPKHISSIENVNPLKFCEVTLGDEKMKNEKLEIENKKIRRYKCLYCKRSFGWSTDLKRHLFTHSGEKPFKCNLCNACYTRRIVLRKHVSKCHRKLENSDSKTITDRIYNETKEKVN